MAVRLQELAYQLLKGEASVNVFRRVADVQGLDVQSSLFAKYLDELDDLRYLRDEFEVPKARDVAPEPRDTLTPDKKCLYLCGNSVGLMPKLAKKFVNEDLDVWASTGVVGHFSHKYNRPWADIADIAANEMAAIVGAKPTEVAVMGSTTVNLHLLMTAFYRPTPKRYKILIEDKAFCSDMYMVESQIRLHGYKVDDALVVAKLPQSYGRSSREGILDLIEAQGDQIALVMMSGVHYFTGELYDIKTITAASHAKGCIVGWDLAHAAGNVVLKLNDWNVDFAAWCTYKYLNSGPGSIASIFVHEKHAHDRERLRFSGWWGHNRSTRFEMDAPFDPIPGAAGYQLSNPSVLATSSLLGSLAVFSKTSMGALRQKSVVLTSYLELLIEPLGLTIITPRNPIARGIQLSIMFVRHDATKVWFRLLNSGVVLDVRKPDVIRIAPAPLYNTFSEVHMFADLLRATLRELEAETSACA